MSDAILKRIEKSLTRLSEQQAEIRERLVRLEQCVAVLPGGSKGVRRDEVIAFLDQFRAGEALGEASLGAWIAVCDTPCLRGGLRTVQMREGGHARLLAERLKELGGSPRFELPEAIYRKTMETAGSDEKSDAEKVKDFVAQFPDADKTLRPILDLADRLDDDHETQSLLRTIARDERASLEFLHDACALLNPS